MFVKVCGVSRLYLSFRAEQPQAKAVILAILLVIALMSVTEKGGRKQAKLEKRVALLIVTQGKSQQLLLVSQDHSVFLTYVHKIILIICLSRLCLTVSCSLALETTQVSVLCALQLVEYQHPAHCKECSRFRKITRGEWLTHSSCCVTKGSYQITLDSRLGETAAVFRSLCLEQNQELGLKKEF